MRVADAIGAQLDWMVAKCEGHDWFLTKPDNHLCVWKLCSLTGEQEVSVSYRPSANWAQGGPIIEREGITVGPADTSPFKACYGPADSTRGTWKDRYVGPTPLVAAMRTYVASKLGEEVEIPPELVS